MVRAGSVWSRLLLVVAVIGGTLMIRASFASATDAVVHGVDVADTYADAGHPTHANGGKSQLYVQNGADQAYLRFSVSGIPADTSSTGAVLRLYAARRSTSGFSVFPTSPTWSESSLTWNNQPGPTGTALGSVGAVSRSGWFTVSLSGNYAANKTYDFVLVGDAGTAYLASRESGNDPTLDVTVPGTPPSTVSGSVPTITGNAQDGYTLQVTPAQYTGVPAPTIRDSWQRCQVDTSEVITSCADTGVTGGSYPVRSADVGSRLRVVETASNGNGPDATQTSVPTSVVAPAPPANTAPPSISGQPVVGQTLTGTTGSWTGTPTISYSPQWLRCPSTGGGCTSISGATALSYVVTSADVNSTLKLQVTATNDAGSATATSAPTAPVTSSAGSTGGTSSTDPVIAAAGDISCDPTSGSYNGGNGTSNACRQKYTAALVQAMNPAAVLDLGDNQYYCGSLQAYQDVYANSWGQFLNITHPSPGNHEYLTSGGTGCDSTNANAAGYFSYFGSRAGSQSVPYYSFNVGSWHLISLDSNCSAAGGCGTTSPQGKWLASDLAANTAKCTLAFWHIPVFSSGGRASPNMSSIFTQLYNANADVVLSGHDHIYERFAPQTPSGQADATRGIREFIAGTGGANHTSIATVAANSEVRNATTFGVLQLTLHPSSYDWKFVPDTGSGSFTDAGSGSCH